MNALTLWLVRPQARWGIWGLHLVLLAAIFLHQGILVDNEALKYVGCAQQVLHGDRHDLTGNYLKYGAYVLFLIPFVALGLPSLAVLAQIALGLVAADAFARLAQRMTNSIVLSRIAWAAFLLCPLIQVWTLALYTEHFFTCATVLFIERLDRSTRVEPLTYGLALVTLFARPVGLFVVVPALVWKWTMALPHAARLALRVASICIVLGTALLMPGIERAQLLPIASGQVIAGVDGIQVPAVGFEGTQIWDAQRYLIYRAGIGTWSCITLERMASLFDPTRLHFSKPHNAINSLLFLLYPLALFGWWKFRADERTTLLATIVLGYTLLIGLTHDEWSGRFLVPLLPAIMLLSMQGALALTRAAPGSSGTWTKAMALPSRA